MALYAGDKGPAKTIGITLQTGAVAGNTVASVRLRVRAPDGSESEWLPSITGSSATTVSLAYSLQSDGSSIPLEGTYFVRGWAYSAIGALLLDTDEAVIRVNPSRHSWPV